MQKTFNNWDAFAEILTYRQTRNLQKSQTAGLPVLEFSLLYMNFLLLGI